MSLAEDVVEIVGEYRRPHNTAAQQKGSIHDDATASKLGFKGGTVAGSLHMDQFIPLLLELYGEDFLKQGNISLYFKQATVDLEAVRCFAKLAPGDTHARLSMENEAGDLINDGTASCAGADTATELSRRVVAQTPAAPGALRILARCRVGATVEAMPIQAAGEVVEKRLETIPERIAAYDSDPRVLPPAVTVNLYRPVQEALLKLESRPVGLFGAIELQNLAGPLRADTAYVGRGRVLALSESPKTENIWYQAWAADPDTGEDVAWMIMYLRFLKASSPLWA
ncbi:MAG TPA: hypothetical protein VFE03_00690 [Caulobacteraceae bacterium]|jgi:hypothetical protein|nr:hypothetical protein [Caulobacteraceae bacterium]